MPIGIGWWNKGWRNTWQTYHILSLVSYLKPVHCFGGMVQDELVVLIPQEYQNV